MSGRTEKEALARKRIESKLKKMPDIFTAYYNWLDVKEKTYNTMERYIDQAVEFMLFFTNGKNSSEFYTKVTDDDIERYLVHIRRKEVDGKVVEVGDSIRATKWSALNTFFGFLVKKKYIENNPVAMTERPKIKTKNAVTYMTQDEIKSVFDRITNESPVKLKNRDVCIVALGLSTGLRVSAMVNIDVEDIDFHTNTIKVVEKGRKTRSIPFADNLRNLILVWLKDREMYYGGKPNSGPLFISRKKQRISVDSVQEMIAKYTNHLPKHITPHKLRSSAAMNLYSSGVGILTIASILGHENVTTTQRYTSAFDQEKENAVSVLDKIIE